MRISKVKSSKSTIYYVIDNVYTPEGRRTTTTIERLGSVEEIIDKHKVEDPHVWMENRLSELIKEQKKQVEDSKHLIEYNSSKQIELDKQNCFDGGYIFLKKIYKELGLKKICNDISKKHQFKYDLNEIMQVLLYTRILSPCSKKSSLEEAQSFIEKPNCELHQVYRGLSVLAQESEYIQSQLYKHSSSVMKRNTGVLYYDCTNFFFEIGEAEGLKQYGISKENRPNPIVQMGLFLDGNGLPLSFSITPGNENEQTTLVPLEKKILKDFGLSKFVVCTDAGLSSLANKKFNDSPNKRFVMVHSLKKEKKFMEAWALDGGGWKKAYFGDKKTIDRKRLSRLWTMEEIMNYGGREDIFYKERWRIEDNIEQRVIVSFSLKQKSYQEAIRTKQFERAKDRIAKKRTTKRANQNDPNRFIDIVHVSDDGEISKKKIAILDEKKFEEESRFDGFYAVSTNLEDDAEEILKVNSNRWKIEESFKMLKSEFEARPVYLKRDDRIMAHFLTCVYALLFFRILENKLDKKYTATEILETLKGFNFNSLKGKGYIPNFTRTQITDDLHNFLGFRMDTELVTFERIRNFLDKLRR